MNDVLETSMRGVEYMRDIMNYQSEVLDLAAQAALLTARQRERPLSVTFHNEKHEVTGYVLCIPNDPELIARVKACVKEEIEA